MLLTIGSSGMMEFADEAVFVLHPKPELSKSVYEEPMRAGSKTSRMAGGISRSA